MKIVNYYFNNQYFQFICEDYELAYLQEVLWGYGKFVTDKVTPLYTLITMQNVEHPTGIYIEAQDQWFNNASLQCWIDNNLQRCYLKVDPNASENDYKSLYQYFIVNYLNRFLELDGYIAFHSSCVAKNDFAVAFIGPRNAGKTNCMLNLLVNGYSFVTNDKLAVCHQDNTIKAYGVYQDISIRMSEKILSKVDNKKYLKIALEQLKTIQKESLIDGNNIHLTIPELIEMNNTVFTPFVSLKMIIFPYYDNKNRELTLLPLSDKEKRELLLSQQVPLVHPTKSFLNLISVGSPQVNDNIINQLASLPCFYCVQNEFTTEEFNEQITSSLDGFQKKLKK